MTSLPPGAILALGGLIAPFLRGRLLQAWMLILPVASFLHLLEFGESARVAFEFFGREIVPIRVDRLALVWGYVFHIAAFLAALFALKVEDRLQAAASAVYAGTAIAAVFAGDLFSLFVWWELTAISSVFLILARRTERALRVGMRYLIVQVLSGVLLLAGAILHEQDVGTAAFESMTLATPGTWLIFLAFGIKAAFPLLHNWLQDAYPEATVTGTVFLSAFTTKLAIYALARGFAGTECLIWIGATMTAFPIFFAVIENDLRRVLAYSLNNQLGFMVVGVGVGTELALNGTAAHAFAHILYKGLLFMAMGAVLLRTGTTKASELGGLYRSMPWTAAFCIVGSLSISAFPLFSGFVSKSLILSAVGDGHHTWIFLVLLLASAGVVDHSGIKVPFFSFFAHDQGHRVKEAPLPMLLAMGLTALLCVGIGLRPDLLYAILPYAVDYAPYTATHVLTQLQLLIFAALAFCILMRTGVYPPEIRSTNLDFDWIYRKAAPALVGTLVRGLGSLRASLDAVVHALAGRGASALRAFAGPAGPVARTWGTSAAVLWIAVLLAAAVVLYVAS